MGYEIDFLPVGEGSKSGDAILLRFGDLTGPRHQQVVVLIDGGFQDTADAVIAHLRRYYATTTIDLIVSTHADADHINGLPRVVQTLDVRELWMHRPSVRRPIIEAAIRSIGTDSYAAQLRESLASATELERIATQRDIPIREPFTGLVHSSGAFSVVGPSEHYYLSLLTTAGEARAERGTLWGYLLDHAREIAARTFESFGVETLTDDGETSPINNTCAITMLETDGQTALFTADAGMPALDAALTTLEASGFVPSMLNFVQVPHHGSRRNVGPSVLDRLLGHRRPHEEVLRTAFVSVAPDGEPKHPSRRVTNAFKRRGSPVHATQGHAKRHYFGAPARDWSPSTPLPFYSEVED